MTRSVWKGKFYNPILLRKIYFLKKYNLLNEKIIEIYNRNSIIFPILLGVTVLIHNGKKFTKLLITSDMIGFKFAEFSFTKRIGMSIHNSNQNNIKEKLKKKK